MIQGKDTQDLLEMYRICHSQHKKKIFNSHQEFSHHFYLQCARSSPDPNVIRFTTPTCIIKSIDSLKACFPKSVLLYVENSRKPRPLRSPEGPMIFDVIAKIHVCPPMVLSARGLFRLDRIARSKSEINCLGKAPWVVCYE